jgi:hypothetical protein
MLKIERNGSVYRYVLALVLLESSNHIEEIVYLGEHNSAEEIPIETTIKALEKMDHWVLDAYPELIKTNLKSLELIDKLNEEFSYTDYLTIRELL